MSPAISLRLTPEQHEQLREWAFGNKRSIQRELIYRIFERMLDERDGIPPVSPPPVAGPQIPSRSSSTTASGCANAHLHHRYSRIKPCPVCLFTGEEVDP